MAGLLGVEQGFTVKHRLAGSAGVLSLRLGLAGSLHARHAGGGIEFVSGSGRVVLRYGGLSAVDARGRRLMAGVVVDGGSLVLRVVARDAVYPVRIDPFAQQDPSSPPPTTPAAIAISATAWRCPRMGRPR